MLRINLEVTKTSTRLEQIEEVVVVNQGRKVGAQTVYQLTHNGDFVAYLLHHRKDGAFALAHQALGILLDPPEDT